MIDARLPKVTVVIVTLERENYLRECLTHLGCLNYPRRKLEVIVIDNGSQDDSAEMVRRQFPHVLLMENTWNRGFAKPCNDGATAASGKYVVFLNNDVRVEPDWLRELVSTAERGGAKCACSLILSADGSAVDFAGGSVNLIGHGLQVGYGLSAQEARETYAQDKEIFFGCGGSLLVERETFLALGGFDESYFAYFEDVDFGWRLRLAGERTLLSVKSICYHHHRSIPSTQPPARLQRLLERNALYTLYKNVSQERLYPLLLSALLIDFQRIKAVSGLDDTRYDVRYAQSPDEPALETIDGLSAAYLCALFDFSENIESLNSARAAVQSLRKASDAEVFAPISDPFDRIALSRHLGVRRAIVDAAQAFNTGRFFEHTGSRALVAGCGSDRALINRAVSLCALLSDAHRVTLAYEGERPAALPENVAFISLDESGALHAAAQEQAVAIVQSPLFARFAQFPERDDGGACWLMADLCAEPPKLAPVPLQDWLLRCDAFSCPDRALRECWLQTLLDTRRISNKDAARARIQLSPMGWDPGGKPPAPARWGHTLWYLGGNDMLCAAQAVARASRTLDEIRLLIPADAVDPSTLPQLRALAASPESHLSIREASAPPEGAVALMSYKPGEHEYPPLLAQCLAQGMPVICADSVNAAPLIERERAGAVYPAGDGLALSRAMLALLKGESAFSASSQNALRIAPLLDNRHTLLPFARFCAVPRRLPDARVLHTDILQKRTERALPEILPDNPVCQRFISRRRGFCQVRLPIATLMRRNSCTVHIEIYDATRKRMIARRTLAAQDLADNQWVSIDFDPQPFCDHRVELRISSPDASVGNAITLWCAPAIDPHAGRLIEGAPEDGLTLAYSTHYRSDCAKPGANGDDGPLPAKKRRKGMRQGIG